jgi:hypothetical protein
MKRFRYGIVLFLTISLLLLIGCAPTNPVRYFLLIRSSDGAPPSFFIPPMATIPFPSITRTFSPLDKVYLMLQTDEKLEVDVNSFKYTFFDKATGNEEEVNFPLDAGPFWPDGIPGFFYVYTESGNYEIRVYNKDKIVAAQSFEVR